MKNHLIFDLDGTLLDSMPIWRTVGANFLKSQGVLPPENYVEIIKSQTLPETAAYFHEKLGIPHSAEEIVSTIIKMVEKQYEFDIPLKPHVLDFLKTQKKAGAKMCIATASELSYVLKALKRLQVLPYFDFVTSCTETGFNKENPAFFHAVAKRLGGNIENTVIFEDALYAVRTAKEAGFHVYAIADETADKEKQKIRSLCDVYVTSFKELLLTK